MSNTNTTLKETDENAKKTTQIACFAKVISCYYKLCSVQTEIKYIGCSDSRDCSQW